jgi:hypothetical protein
VPEDPRTRHIHIRQIEYRGGNVIPTHLMPVKNDHHGKKHKRSREDAKRAANIKIPQIDRGRPFIFP